MSDLNCGNAATDGSEPQGKSVSLILPAWNEAEALPRAIAEADAALHRIAVDYEIIVVDDGSLDDTAHVVHGLVETYPAVRLVQHASNIGYGAALRTGFAAARCDLVAFTDADNQFNLEELDRFVLLSKDYKSVCGYRIDRKDTWLRRFYSRGYNFLVRCLLGTSVRDIDCALKVFHRETVQQLEITTDGFLVNCELLTQIAQQQISIVEVGVSHRPRVEGTSTVSVKHIPAVFTQLFRFWWNRVQFPGTVAALKSQRRSEGSQLWWTKAAWAPALLLVLAAALLLSNLGYPLIDRDETRYAEIPREMVASGDWIMPQLNFEPYVDKPPLLYWLCSLSYSLFGVSEWSARLPQALCALGAIATTLWFGSRWFGRTAGLLSATVLLFSVGFIGVSRVLLIDGLLTFLTTLSLCCAFEAVCGSKLRRGWWLAAGVACGAAFLAKGPIAIVLLGPPIAAYSFLTKGSSQPRIRDWALLLGVVAAAAGPWFVAVSLEVPSFAYDFFYKHNITRFAGAYHSQPFWYFLPILLVAGHPWSFLTIPFARFFASRRQSDQALRPPVLGFLFLWSAWCVLFFSASQCKLPTYIFPAFPALAMMMGWYLHRRVFAADRGLPLRFFERVAPWNAAIASAVAGIGFAIFAWTAKLETTGVAVAIGAVWIVLLTAAIALRFTRCGNAAAWGLAGVLTLLLGVFATQRVIPQYARRQTLFGPGSRVLAETSGGRQAAIATLGHEWSEAPFYLNRSDIKHFYSTKDARLEEYLHSKGRVLIVMRTQDYSDNLAEELPAGTRVKRIGQRGPGIVVEATISNVASAPSKSDSKAILRQ